MDSLRKSTAERENEEKFDRKFPNIFFHQIINGTLAPKLNYN
jgi:hypothetical protein